MRAGVAPSPGPSRLTFDASMRLARGERRAVRRARRHVPRVDGAGRELDVETDAPAVLDRERRRDRDGERLPLVGERDGGVQDAVPGADVAHDGDGDVRRSGRRRRRRAPRSSRRSGRRRRGGSRSVSGRASRCPAPGCDLRGRDAVGGGHGERAGFAVALFESPLAAEKVGAIGGARAPGGWRGRAVLPYFAASQRFHCAPRAARYSPLRTGSSWPPCHACIEGAFVVDLDHREDGVVARGGACE